MAPLPLKDAIPRFKINEDRVDVFTNGSNTETWTTSDGRVLPSLAKFIKDKDDFFNNASGSILEQVVDARDTTVSAASEARIAGRTFNTVAEFQAATIDVDTLAIRLNGYYSAGDGGGAMYVRLSAAPGLIEAWHKQSADGAWWELKADVVSPQMFGAMGDGVADDAGAVEVAMRYPARFDWGGKLYRLARTVVPTLSSPIQWQASGARIIFDPPAVLQQVISLPAISVTGDQIIRGALSINANRKAHQGLSIRNNTDTFVDIEIDDISVSNVYRASSSLPGGDGISIEGSFKTVILRRPKVTSVLMAAGAGVSGSQGVTGIVMKASAPGRAPLQMIVEDAYIDGVYSEDATYLADQDGIRAFSEEDSPGDNRPRETKLTVRGGTFRNCAGRSIKSQTEMSLIDGVKLIKTRGPSVAQTQPDIDFQVGGGQVSDLDFHYDGFVPSCVVGCGAPTTASKTINYGSVDGVKGVVSGSAILPAVVQNGMRSTTRQVTSLSHVDVRGGLEKVVRFNSGNGGDSTLLMDHIVAAPTLAFVQSGSIAGTGKIKASKCVNLGAEIPFLAVVSSSFYPVADVQSDCLGFISPKRLNAVTDAVHRIRALAPLDAAVSGLLRLDGVAIADGETYKLPQSFHSNANAGILMISVAFNRNSQGIFACDNSAVAALAAGSEFVVGTTTEPATGNFRVWTGSDGPRITNRSGQNRIVSILMFG